MPATDEAVGLDQVIIERATGGTLMSAFRKVWFNGLDVPGVLHVPTGRLLPPLAGGDETPEEQAAREAQEAADAARAETEAREEEDGGPPPEEWDQERAARTIRAQRQAEAEATRRAEAAEARLRAIEQENETERERAERERDEALATAATNETALRESRLDIAIRDVAADRDVDPRRIRRLSQLVQADGVSFTDEGQPEGIEDAVDQVLADFPELVVDGTGSSSPANGARRRTEKGMTVDEAKTIAVSDPDKFNELWEAGKIPAGALGKT